MNKPRIQLLKQIIEQLEAQGSLLQDIIDQEVIYYNSLDWLNQTTAAGRIIVENIEKMKRAVSSIQDLAGDINSSAVDNTANGCDKCETGSMGLSNELLPVQHLLWDAEDWAPSSSNWKHVKTLTCNFCGWYTVIKPNYSSLFNFEPTVAPDHRTGYSSDK